MSSRTDESTFTPISTLGEFGLINRIRARIGSPRRDVTKLGIGDDAAVISVSEGSIQVFSTDLLVEHVHFDRTYTPMRHLGYKAIASNVSDVAAMFASPDVATVSLGIPNSVSVEMIDSFYDGIAEAAEHYGLDIVGGDITGASKLVVSIAIIGHTLDDEPVYRSGAQASDLLCVTGTLGSAYAGLRILQRNKERMLVSGEAFEPDLAEHAFVVQRHLQPDARIDSVYTLRSAGIRPTAMIDISDGLASEVRHICTQSSCSARIMAEAIPIDERTRKAAASVDEDPFAYALFGGEEYQLLFTIEPADAEDLGAIDRDFTIIGSCVPTGGEPEIIYEDGTSQPLMVAGFKHF